MRKLTREQEAIELGKIWMKKSLDVGGHDYEHAATVEKHALCVLSELVADNPEIANEIDENMVRLAAWWHDAYKATTSKQTVKDLFCEGRLSEEIFRRECYGYILPDRMNKIAFAIRYHNKPWRFFYRIKNTPILLRLLLEADGPETYQKERFIKVWNKNRNVFFRIKMLVIRYGLILFFMFFPFTQYARRISRDNI